MLLLSVCLQKEYVSNFVFSQIFFSKQFGLRKMLNDEHCNQKINGNQYLIQHKICLKLYLPMHEHNNGQNSDIKIL